MVIKSLRNSILILLTLCCASACNKSKSTPQDSKLVGIAKPIILSEDTTRILLSDLFVQELKIDSIASDGEIETSFIGNSLFLVKSKQPKKRLGNITIFAEGLPYSIPVKLGVPIDTYAEDLSLSASSHTKTELVVRTKNITDMYAYWNNFRVQIKEDGDSFHVLIPPFAKYERRSYIRVFGSNTNHIANELLIPLQKGKVITDVQDLKSSDWHSAIIGKVQLWDLVKESTNTSPLRNLADSLFVGAYNTLGINTIWVSEFNPQRNNVPLSLSTIDPNLGTSEDIKAMLNAAHKNGISVLFNYIANPVSSNHRAFKEHQDWKLETTSLATDSLLTFIDLENQPATKYFVDSASYWLNYYDFDGISYIGSRYIPNHYFRAITTELKKMANNGGKPYFQIGEPNNMKEGISTCIENGMLDSEQDNQLGKTLYTLLLSQSANFELFVQKMRSTNFLQGGNHLLINETISKDSLMSDEDEAIYNAMMLFLPGIPTFNTSSLFQAQQLNSILSLRQQNLALIYGSTEILERTNDLIVLKRKYFNQEVYLTLKRTTSSSQVNSGLESSLFKDQFEIKSKNWQCKIASK